MRTRNIQWASDQQKEYFEAGPDPILALGGFNAAKTWGGVLKLLYLLDTFKNSRAAVVRSTFKHLRRTTMETFYALCPQSAYEKGRRSDQDGICQLNNGSLIHFLGLDKPESLDILAGLEINFGFIDQAEQVVEKAADTLDARLGRWAQAEIPQYLIDMYPEGWPWTSEAGDLIPPPFFFLTANPPDSMEHWLYRRFADESEERAMWRDRGYRFIRMPTTSNKFASKANIQKLKSKDEQFVRKYVEGLWSNPEGHIFDVSELSILEYSPELLKRIIDHMHLHRAMDHGDTSPTCVLWCATDHDGNIFVYREHYAGNTLLSDHRRIVFEWSRKDVPSYSAAVKPNYRSNIADPSIFGLSRGRTATSKPTWSISDEWRDPRIAPEETAVYWTPAPLPKSEGEPYELVTRSRLKEYLKVDPEHRHPITGQKGAPHLYFIRKSDDYPQGVFWTIKELRNQRRVQIGERDGRAIYSEERDETIPDHAYDTIKYHVISRPGPLVIVPKVDPNLINIQELMEWTARNRARRSRPRGGY